MSHIPGTAFELYRGAPAILARRPRRGEAPIVYADNDVRLRGDPLGEIWWQGRQWAVTSDGLEARDGCYFIAADRLTEDTSRHSWPEHVCLKTWVDVDDFETAWLIALALHNSSTGLALLAAIRRAPPPQPPEDGP